MITILSWFFPEMEREFGFRAELAVYLGYSDGGDNMQMRSYALFYLFADVLEWLLLRLVFHGKMLNSKSPLAVDVSEKNTRKQRDAEIRFMNSYVKIIVQGGMYYLVYIAFFYMGM